MPAIASALAMSLLLPAASGASLCMENNDWRPGVLLRPCDGNPNQQWELRSHNSPSTFLIALSRTVPVCLAADSTNNGDTLSTAVCVDEDILGPGMLWHFKESHFFIGQDKCVDAGDMSEDFDLMIWDCNGLSQQIWGYDADMKTIYLSDSRRLQGGLRSAMAESMPEGGSRSLRGSPPAEQVGANISREALRGSSSGGATCEGLGGELKGAAGSFCCGDAGKQIVCGPGSACGEGRDAMPICQEPGGIACQGVAGELRGAAGSKCCGASGHQIVCGPGSHCAGADKAPICGGPVTCAGRAGIPLTAAAGAICCGDEGYQIACGPGARCAGRPRLPICVAR